jgi:hypothetical protein
MNELMQQTSNILTQAQEWLKMPGVEETVRGPKSPRHAGMGTLLKNHSNF